VGGYLIGQGAHLADLLVREPTKFEFWSIRRPREPSASSPRKRCWPAPTRSSSGQATSRSPN